MVSMAADMEIVVVADKVVIWAIVVVTVAVEEKIADMAVVEIMDVVATVDMVVVIGAAGMITKRLITGFSKKRGLFVFMELNLC
jgi:molybdate-binding protein